MNRTTTRPWVRLAEPDDKDMVADVAPTAVPSLGGKAVHEMRDFAAAVCGERGCVAVPHGFARMLVGGFPGTSQPAGLIYFLPPVQLINECATSGPSVQERLAKELADVELLAVAANAQRAGLGTALLEAAEAEAQQRGVRVVIAKVAAQDSSLHQWWSNRGYTLGQFGSSVRIELDWCTLGCVDRSSEYRIAVKNLSRPPHHLRTPESGACATPEEGQP